MQQVMDKEKQDGPTQHDQDPAGRARLVERFGRVKSHHGFGIARRLGQLPAK